MAPHLLCVRASKADWPHLSISAGEDQAICGSVNEAVSAIADLVVVVAVVHKRDLDIEIDPVRERYTMLWEIDGFLGRIEVSLLLYIQFVCFSLKPGRGVMSSSPQDSFRSSRYKRRNHQGGNL
jgi:hypothetical protein